MDTRNKETVLTDIMYNFTNGNLQDAVDKAVEYNKQHNLFVDLEDYVIVNYMDQSKRLEVYARFTRVYINKTSHTNTINETLS